MKIAVLAVQGAFIEHETILTQLGAQCIELRKASDITDDIDGIVLPGGESTVQSKLMHDLCMFDKLSTMIKNGVPVLATCAGMILLAESIYKHTESHFKTLPITVMRNAYGRQLGSFSDIGLVKYIEDENNPFPLEFIRAPYIESINDDEVEIISVIDKMPQDKTGTIIFNSLNNDKKNVVGVKYKNQLAFSYHPELTEDIRIHKMFLNMCK